MWRAGYIPGDRLTSWVCSTNCAQYLYISCYLSDIKPVVSYLSLCLLPHFTHSDRLPGVAYTGQLVSFTGLLWSYNLIWTQVNVSFLKDRIFSLLFTIQDYVKSIALVAFSSLKGTVCQELKLVHRGAFNSMGFAAKSIYPPPLIYAFSQCCAAEMFFTGYKMAAVQIKKNSFIGIAIESFYFCPLLSHAVLNLLPTKLYLTFLLSDKTHLQFISSMSGTIYMCGLCYLKVLSSEI